MTRQEKAAGRYDPGLVQTGREDALVHGLLSGITVFRWLAWAWLLAVLALSQPELGQPDTRPWVAYGLATAAGGVTLAATVLWRRRPSALLSGRFVALEVIVSVGLMVGDQLAYQGVDRPQGLGSAWPLAGIFTAGIAFGTRGGLVGGVAVGLGRMTANLMDPTMSIGDRGQWVASVSTVVLYALAGGTAGFVTARLRSAERRIGFAQAREEVARTLHDGVLQTLAVVQRRADDDDLTRLAREQERELREFLFGASSEDGGGDLGSQLRQAAATCEDRFGLTAKVVVAPDVPTLLPASATALAGAVAEALTNAGKHAQATKVTVYVEPADDTDVIGDDTVDGGAVVFCSVKDDGSGFDTDSVTEGVGLRSSIRARIEEVGGRVEVDGRPGRGAEVRCWVPVVPSAAA